MNFKLTASSIVIVGCLGMKSAERSVFILSRSIITYMYIVNAKWMSLERYNLFLVWNLFIVSWFMHDLYKRGNGSERCLTCLHISPSPDDWLRCSCVIHSNDIIPAYKLGLENLGLCPVFRTCTYKISHLNTILQILTSKHTVALIIIKLWFFFFLVNIPL